VERVVAKSFQDLMVWQKAHQWVLDVYRMTARFPKEELFGLTSQLRRSAVSVPANIAEGFKRRGKSDKLRFYNISQGSLEEARYYHILGRDLRYCAPDPLIACIDQIAKMLDTYIVTIERSR
jgi:four helix bundle protein